MTFAFKLRAVARRDDPYFDTRWDRATPITVVADTKQDAINKADAALGDAGRHLHWVFKCDAVEDVLLANATTGDDK